MKNFATDYGANPLAPDNTAAILACLAASNGDDMVLPKGGYKYHSNAVNWNTSGRVIGEGYGDSRFLSLDPTGDLFTISAGYCSMENIGFGSVVPRTGGAFLALAPTSGFNHLEHIVMRDYYYGLKVNTSAGLTVRDLDVQNCSSTGGIGIDINCNPGTGLAMSISDFLISSTIPVDTPGFFRPAFGMRVRGSGDLTLMKGNIILSQTALALVPDAGQELSSFCSTLVYCDNSSNNGLAISPKGRVLRCILTDNWFASSGNVGALIDTSAGGYVDMISFARPRIYCNGTTTGNPGIYVNGSGTRSIDIEGAQCAGNGNPVTHTGSGMLMNTPNESFTIRGGYSGNVAGFGGNAAYGIDIVPGAQQFVVAGIPCNGNGIGPVNNPGGGSLWRQIFGVPGYA